MRYVHSAGTKNFNGKYTYYICTGKTFKDDIITTMMIFILYLYIHLSLSVCVGGWAGFGWEKGVRVCILP